MPTNIISLSEAKDWLGIDHTKADTTLTFMVNSVNQSIANLVEVEFSLTPITNELLDGNGSDMVITNRNPISSIEGLYFYPGTDGANGSLIDPSNYLIREYAVVLYGLKSPVGRSTIRVDYTHGYNGVPGDVKEAALLSVEAKYYRKGNKSIGSSRARSKSGESVGGSDASGWDNKTGLPIEVVAMLRPYTSFEFPTISMATRSE